MLWENLSQGEKDKGLHLVVLAELTYDCQHQPGAILEMDPLAWVKPTLLVLYRAEMSAPLSPAQIRKSQAKKLIIALSY